MSQAITTQAIILRRINHGESDRVVTLLTSDAGRLSAYAKGVRKQKSKLAGGLELCMLSDISFVPSKRTTGLATITSTRMREYYGEIVKDYDVLQETFTLLRFVDKASEYEEDTTKLFQLTIELLRALNAKTVSNSAASLWFLQNLTSMLGQGIRLEKPTNTSVFEENARYIFDFEAMGFENSENGIILPADIKLLKLMLIAQTPQKLKNIVHLEVSVARLEKVSKFLHQQITQL